MSGFRTYIAAIIDPDRCFRYSLRERLNQDPRTAGILEYESAEHFLSEPGDCDILWLEALLPRMPATAFLGRLRRRRLSPIPAIISRSARTETILQCLRAGSCGYVWKPELRDPAADSMNLLIGGGVFSPTPALRLIRYLRK